MNILILVMSARREPWGAMMDCSLETWDSQINYQTRTLYYCGKSSFNPPDEKVFYSPVLTEELDDVSSRTIEAFEKSLELEWGFMARPNSSCYVHKRNLVKFCETLPRENTICGILTEGERPFLWGGCQYIFSRDVIEKMVANKDKWNHKAMDDQSITYMAQELGIPLKSNGWCASINMLEDGEYQFLVYNAGCSFCFTDFSDPKLTDPNYGGSHFFVRVKQDLRRHEDLRIMRELHRHWK